MHVNIAYVIMKKEELAWSNGMEKAALVQQLKKYLFEVLGISLPISPWNGVASLPIFLTKLYAFYEVLIEGKRCILIIQQEELAVPSVLEKHLRAIEAKTQCLSLYVLKEISSYTRKWLIAHRISFVVPRDQMYLPELGLDLRERFRRTQQPKKTKTLSPSAQAVIIHGLLHPEIGRIIPSALAKHLNYTAMTMTRVLNELELLDICAITRIGKKRYLDFGESRRELWEQARSLMRTPIKKRIWVWRKGGAKQKELANIAGLDALARQSMLNGPAYPIFAIWEDRWKKTISLQEVESADEADLEIELWSYNPELFAKNGLVDPFSLFLSLHEEKDDRTQIALEKLMEKVQW